MEFAPPLQRCATQSIMHIQNNSVKENFVVDKIHGTHYASRTSARQHSEYTEGVL